MEKLLYKHKRRYIEIKQESDKYNSQTIFKPKLKLDILIDNIDNKLSLIAQLLNDNYYNINKIL